MCFFVHISTLRTHYHVYVGEFAISALDTVIEKNMVSPRTLPFHSSAAAHSGRRVCFARTVMRLELVVVVHSPSPDSGWKSLSLSDRLGCGLCRLVASSSESNKAALVFSWMDL